MKLVVQRVTRAEVRVEGEVVGAIGRGMLVLLCVLEGDTLRTAERLAERLAAYRFFPEPQEAGGSGKARMNRSALDVGAACLVVSQFTLAADGRKGRRPSFDGAARPELAAPLCGAFADHLRVLGLAVETGRFGAMMEVELVNDGPVTLLLEASPGS